MPHNLTFNSGARPRALSFFAGLGMTVASVLTIRHFFEANYPASIYQGSFCDISAFFNCGSAATSVIAQVAGVPLGYFGMVVGALVCLGAVFSSGDFERTNRSLSLLNAIGVVSLFLFSILYLRSLCPLCSVYYLFSLFSLVLFWHSNSAREQGRGLRDFFRPSAKYLITFAVLLLFGAYGLRLYHDARKEAQSGGATARMVNEYFALPAVHLPSVISPYWTVRSTERFEDAPIQVIEYADFLCPDCFFLSKQIEQLRKDFSGKLNIAFQFFPLDAQCNTVVEKNKHPGSCELSYLAAYDPAKFAAIHDEIWANFRAAKDPEWRRSLARRYAVEAALTDARTKEIVQKIIQTGAEYEKTSEKYAHGIRSTPTMIINNRMVIGTFPYQQMRALFQAILDKQQAEKRKFMENWAPDKP